MTHPMENIILPTDLFARLQDLDLDANQQLVYLALILNRPVNMTGVYVLRRRELLAHLLPSIESQTTILNSIEVLKSKGLIYYHNDVLFVPLIPETSKLGKHNYRARMNAYVEKLRHVRGANDALSAYQKWYSENTQPASQNDEQTDITEIEKSTEMTQKPERTMKNSSKTSANQENMSKIEMNQIAKTQTGVPRKRHRPSPQNGVPLSISISSSISSSSSSGKERQGGAGEFSGLGDYQIFEEQSGETSNRSGLKAAQEGDDEDG